MQERRKYRARNSGTQSVRRCERLSACNRQLYKIQGLKYCEKFVKPALRTDGTVFHLVIKMALKLIMLGLLHYTAAMPTNKMQDMEMVDDTASVGTYIRAVRATAPEDFHKSYESQGDGEIGYSRKKTGGGKKGYQHFDSYHKKAGDHYELETEDSYGEDDEGHAAAHSHQHEQKERYRERKPESNAEAETEETEDAERVKDNRPEIEHEELKEGAPDGNGGVEAHGHDPNDYILPEKYTYGTGEEYDF